MRILTYYSDMQRLNSSGAVSELYKANELVQRATRHIRGYTLQSTVVGQRSLH